MKTMATTRIANNFFAIFVNYFISEAWFLLSDWLVLSTLPDQSLPSFLFRFHDNDKSEIMVFVEAS